MTELTLSSRPSRSYRASRRRAGQDVLIVCDNCFTTLDPIADTVWQSMDGERDVEAIAVKVAAEHSLAPGYAVAATIGALAAFANLELASW